MGIYHIPSFWDDLGQGIAQGTQNFFNARQTKQQNELAKANLFLQLNNTGQIDAGTLQQQLAQVGINTPIQPNAEERRRKILENDKLGSGVGGKIVGKTPTKTGFTPKFALTPSASDDERRAAGLLTSSEKATSDLTKRDAELRIRFSRGEPMGDDELRSIGQLPLGEREAQRLKGLDPILGDQAKNFVAQVSQMMGGRIDPKMGLKAADQAYELYRQRRKMTRLGNFSPEDEIYAKSFFHNAMNDFLQQQHQNDIAEKVAGRALANSDPIAKLRDDVISQMQQDETTARNYEAQIADINRSPFGAVIQLYAGKPDDQIPDQYRQPVTQYRTMIAEINSIRKRRAGQRKAYASLAKGIMPQNIDKLMLGEDDTVPDTGGSKPPATGAPAASTPTKGGAPPMTPELINQYEQQMRGMDPKIAKQRLDAALAGGGILQKDYDTLKKRLGL